MPAIREAVTMPGGGIKYMNMNRPDLLSVARIQKTDTPAISNAELAEDGKKTGAGLPVDELTQMINQLKVKKGPVKPQRNVVAGQGVKGRRVAYV